MAIYYQEIQSVVRSALTELAQEQAQGRLVDAPKTNELFILRWITKVLKSQRFASCVGRDLTRWQQLGRSLGQQANLLMQFHSILRFYTQFFERYADKPITDHQIEQFLDELTQSGWEISTSEPLVGCGKVQIFTEGQNSLALCATQCHACFDGENLVKPMSWFVRGDHLELIERAAQAGFMLHKRSDYKSNVKYHGEYVIYPKNWGEQLAEIPLSFQVKEASISL